MRIFVAIRLPRPLYSYCRKLQKNFPKLKKTDEFHLTLQFLGDDIENPDVIIERLKKIKSKPFEIKIGDILPFGPPKEPRGVWIECGKNVELEKLADAVRKSMEKPGYVPNHPFRAHITLGRYKQKPETLPKKIKGALKRFQVEEFELIQSRLTEKGPKYKTLRKFQLKEN
jgi:2'-5' RNA ligase